MAAEETDACCALLTSELRVDLSDYVDQDGPVKLTSPAPAGRASPYRSAPAVVGVSEAGRPPTINRARVRNGARRTRSRTREAAYMRNPRGIRISGCGALAIGTVTLALAGCGANHSASTGPSASATTTTATSAAAMTPVGPVVFRATGAAPTTPTSTTGTSTTAAPEVAQFDTAAAPLLDALFAASRRLDSSCCAGTDYAAEASELRTYRAANMTFVSGLAGLSPPPVAASAVQSYVAASDTYIGGIRRLLTAVLSRDRPGIRAAIHADPYPSAQLDAMLASLGVSNSDVVGYWDGNVTQHGPGKTTLGYFVQMTTTDGAPGASAGTTSYDSLHCAGRLTLTSAQGILHVYRERITSGIGQCGEGGMIYTTVLGGAMAWRWVATGIEVLGELDHLQRPGS